jgi:hypothetical protein
LIANNKRHHDRAESAAHRIGCTQKYRLLSQHAKIVLNGLEEFVVRSHVNCDVFVGGAFQAAVTALRESLNPQS